MNASINGSSRSIHSKLRKEVFIEEKPLEETKELLPKVKRPPPVLIAKKTSNPGMKNARNKLQEKAEAIKNTNKNVLTQSAKSEMSELERPITPTPANINYDTKKRDESSDGASAKIPIINPNTRISDVKNEKKKKSNEIKGDSPKKKTHKKHRDTSSEEENQKHKKEKEKRKKKHKNDEEVKV
jgi:hypothetical protein